MLKYFGTRAILLSTSLYQVWPVASAYKARSTTFKSIKSNQLSIHNFITLKHQNCLQIWSSKNHRYNKNQRLGALTMAKARTALEEQSSNGEFKRIDAAWRNWISSEEGARHPPEAGRYHLYVAYACPWAHRTLMTRALKGLEDVISYTVVHPTWRRTRPEDPEDTHTGWIFGNSQGSPFRNSVGKGGPFPPAYPHNGKCVNYSYHVICFVQKSTNCRSCFSLTQEPDPLLGAASIRDIYEKSGDTEGKYSVPILYDKLEKTIVSNESAEIIRMLNSEFNQFAKYPELDLYPSDPTIRSAIEEVNEWIYPTINNGVYRCGFATSQAAYDKAITELTESFDRLESILSKSRFLTGDKLTEADIRLFVTLLRFDEVYVVYFKTNTRSVANSLVLLNYCRDIYQMPGVAETVNMEQIKTHYYTSHPVLNTYSIIPRGPDFETMLKLPHTRSKM